MYAAFSRQDICSFVSHARDDHRVHATHNWMSWAMLHHDELGGALKSAPSTPNMLAIEGRCRPSLRSVTHHNRFLLAKMCIQNESPHAHPVHAAKELPQDFPNKASGRLSLHAAGAGGRK
jgi:hypothetical protein